MEKIFSSLDQRHAGFKHTNLPVYVAGYFLSVRAGGGLRRKS
jgi:hypothetical protein